MTIFMKELFKIVKAIYAEEKFVFDCYRIFDKIKKYLR